MRFSLSAICVALVLGSTPAEGGRKRLRATLDEAAQELRGGSPDEALARLSDIDPSANRGNEDDVLRFHVLRGLARLGVRRTAVGLADLQVAYELDRCSVFLDSLAGIDVSASPWASWMEAGCLRQTGQLDTLNQRLEPLSGEDPAQLLLLGQRYRVVVLRSGQSFQIGLGEPGDAGPPRVFPWVVGAGYLREVSRAVDQGLERFPGAERLRALQAELMEPSGVFQETPAAESQTAAVRPADSTTDGQAACDDEHGDRSKPGGGCGLVMARVLVDKEGHVTHVEIVSAEPLGVFEDAVRAALLQWRYLPHLEGKARRFVQRVRIAPE